jgi:hypothetical protein
MLALSSCEVGLEGVIRGNRSAKIARVQQRNREATLFEGEGIRIVRIGKCT